VKGEDFEGLLGFKLKDLSGEVFETEYKISKFKVSWEIFGLGVLVSSFWFFSLRRRDLN
jgi:hypothetical protein